MRCKLLGLHLLMETLTIYPDLCKKKNRATLHKSLKFSQNELGNQDLKKIKNKVIYYLLEKKKLKIVFRVRIGINIDH